MEHLISIVVEIKQNCENLLTYLTNLNKQTYKNYELILIGKPNQENIVICETFAKKENNVKCLFDNNKSLGELKNFAIENLSNKSDYVVFLNTNEQLNNEYLAKQLNCILENNADIAICNYNKHNNKKDQLTIFNNITFQDFLFYSSSNQDLGNKIFKTELVKKCLFEKFLEHGQNFLFLFDYSKFIDKAVYYQNSLIIKNNNKNKINLNEKYIFIKKINKIIKNIPNNLIQTEIYAKSFLYLCELSFLFQCCFFRGDKHIKNDIKNSAKANKGLFLSVKKDFSKQARIMNFFGNFIL